MNFENQTKSEMVISDLVRLVRTPHLETEAQTGAREMILPNGGQTEERTGWGRQNVPNGCSHHSGYLFTLSRRGKIAKSPLSSCMNEFDIAKDPYHLILRLDIKDPTLKVSS